MVAPTLFKQFVPNFVKRNPALPEPVEAKVIRACSPATDQFFRELARLEEVLPAAPLSDIDQFLNAQAKLEEGLLPTIRNASLKSAKPVEKGQIGETPTMPFNPQLPDLQEAPESRKSSILPLFTDSEEALEALVARFKQAVLNITGDSIEVPKQYYKK